jgi:hypothetical protein
VEDSALTNGRKLAAGLTAIAIGIFVTIAASLFVHAAESPTTDAVGNELYSFVPRGWFPATLGQLVAIGGIFMILGGTTLAFVYGRPFTWARAAIGAWLFTAMALVVFAVIPNQWVALTQSSLEWTPQKIFVTIPPALVLGNEVAISYSTLQQMIVGGYPVVMLILIATVMVQWQKRTRAVEKPKPTPVSSFGRPMKEGPG